MEPNTLSTTNLVARIIRQPTLLIASGSLIIGAGLYLNWPAVTALGLAPLILTFAPCALMCAVGLCAMSARKNKSDGKPPTQDQDQGLNQ